MRELEQPLKAWRSFRDVARAMRSLSAVQAMHWALQVARAEQHLRVCERELSALGPGPREPIRARVVLAIGTDLGLCGPLNHRVAEACAGLAAPPTVLSVVVGSRLAALQPLPDAIELPAPSSFEAIELLAVEIEDAWLELPEPRELAIVLAGEIAGDALPEVEVRRGRPPTPSDNAIVHVPLVPRASLLARARALVRHARLVAALARATLSENEARWRTMSRAHESANRRIDEQEAMLRRLAQEQITQEMLEARQGAR
uniref:ATP synthase F1 gamma subunit n=1 Tax=uncultured bacterium pSY1435 TaxID=561717 RepID=C4N427_9BACT|nr:ATP synthase F1 gamma subunit [uncultured bacterium pSY1435]